MNITREFYEAFQRVELQRLDDIVASDVTINSPAGWGMQGLETLKGFVTAFAQGVARRIDLLDEHIAVDHSGDGRGFITVNLDWKHSQPVFGLQPTGREGTSIESLIMTLRGGRIVAIEVAAHTLDLAIHLWQRGAPMPHNVRPPVLVTGVSRG